MTTCSTGRLDNIIPEQKKLLSFWPVSMEFIPGGIKKWKKIAVDGIMEFFTDRKQRRDKEKNLLIEELYREIGQLKVELGLPVREKALCIDRKSNTITVTRQAELLGIARLTVYYQPVVDIYSLELMHQIDKQYTKTPFYGSRRITQPLKRKGYSVNRKKVQRLMRLMGIEAIYPGPNTTASLILAIRYTYIFSEAGESLGLMRYGVVILPI